MDRTVSHLNFIIKKSLIFLDDLSSLETAEDIMFYVHSIPFMEDYKDPSLVCSPDFMLSQNKGTIDDHVLLLACMLMGCSYETIDDIPHPSNGWKSASKKSDDWISMADRVFVCKGLNKFTSKSEFWLMIYSRDFKEIKFYDVRNNVSMVLRGRVRTQKINILKSYLTFNKDDHK